MAIEIDLARRRHVERPSKLSKVLLPLPLGPMIARYSPVRTDSEMSDSAVTLPSG